MKLKLISILILLISFSAHARMPAVEAVHGVIPADYQVVPVGQEVSINFKNEITALGKTDKQQKPSNPWVGFIGLLAMMALPGLMWFQLTHNNPTLEEVAKDTDSPKDSHENVSRLDDYRKDNDGENDVDSEHKKAS